MGTGVHDHLRFLSHLSLTLMLTLTRGSLRKADYGGMLIVFLDANFNPGRWMSASTRRSSPIPPNTHSPEAQPAFEPAPKPNPN